MEIPEHGPGNIVHEFVHNILMTAMMTDRCEWDRYHLIFQDWSEQQSNAIFDHSLEDGKMILFSPGSWLVDTLDSFNGWLLPWYYMAKLEWRRTD